MELHDDEYYRLKYMKYKAKYQELQRKYIAQSGGLNCDKYEDFGQKAACREHNSDIIKKIKFIQSLRLKETLAEQQAICATIETFFEEVCKFKIPVMIDFANAASVEEIDTKIEKMSSIKRDFTENDGKLDKVIKEHIQLEQKYKSAIEKLPKRVLELDPKIQLDSYESQLNTQHDNNSEIDQALKTLESTIKKLKKMKSDLTSTFNSEGDLSKKCIGKMIGIDKAEEQLLKEREKLLRNRRTRFSPRSNTPGSNTPGSNTPGSNTPESNNLQSSKSTPVLVTKFPPVSPNLIRGASAPNVRDLPPPPFPTALLNKVQK